jgi:hypothetical protein
MFKITDSTLEDQQIQFLKEKTNFISILRKGIKSFGILNQV